MNAHAPRITPPRWFAIALIERSADSVHECSFSQPDAPAPDHLTNGRRASSTVRVATGKIQVFCRISAASRCGHHRIELATYELTGGRRVTHQKMGAL